ncbi:MAG: hypothetical protein U0231_14055 [Nitrospiraceae bacterium]
MVPTTSTASRNTPNISGTKRYKHVQVLLSRYRSPVSCPTCNGTRPKPAARFVKLAGLDITELSDLTIEAAAGWFERLALPTFDAEIAKDITP